MQGLALLIQEGLKRDPNAGNLYVFGGRVGSLVKSRWHDGVGLSLYAKRLERGRFVWPSAKDGIMALTTRIWPVCSTGSTGGTRGEPGGQRRRDKS